MMNISYKDRSGVDRAEFGDEVLNAARAIMETEGSEVTNTAST
jgi:hypothetical protein